MRGSTYKFAYILTLAGIADSIYLLYTGSQAYCPLGGCGSLSVFFLPHYTPALLGLLWFLSSLIVFSWNNRFLMLAWRFLSVLGMFFLATYAILHHYFCPYCFAAYVIGAILIWISEKEFG